MSLALVSATQVVDFSECLIGAPTPLPTSSGGMRLRSEGVTEAWLGFYPFLVVSIFSFKFPLFGLPV